jgi:hypothetical protein
MLGLLLDIDPLGPLAAVIELVGVAIFFKRLGPSIRRVDWRDRGPARHAAAASLAIVANIVFINYLAGANAGDFDLVRTHQILALDHMMFVGVLTNAIFAMLLRATTGDGRWAQLDTVVFVGINVGVIGFVVSLLAESIGLRQIATPILGACILIGLGLHTIRLRSAGPIASPAVTAAAAATR